MSDTFDHLCDAYEPYMNGDDSGPNPWDKTCKFCGEGGFVMQQTKSGGWWLADKDGQWHNCDVLWARREDNIRFEGGSK